MNNNIHFFIDMKYRIEEQIQLCDTLLRKERMINHLSNINNEEYEIIHNFKQYTNQLKQKHNDINDLLEHIKDHLTKHCQHEWETDVIDVKYDMSLNIKYCNTCGMNAE